MTYPWVTGERLYSADLNDAIANAGGLIQIGTEVTFAAASSISVDSCFSTDHDWYQIRFRWAAGSGTPLVNMRMRAAGVDDSSTNYNDSNGGSGASQMAVAAASVGGGWGCIDVWDPASTVATVTRGPYALTVAAPAISQLSGAHNVTAAFDGFTLIPATSTLTGSLRVYGYRND